MMVLPGQRMIIRYCIYFFWHSGVFRNCANDYNRIVIICANVLISAANSRGACCWPRNVLREICSWYMFATETVNKKESNKFRWYNESCFDFFLRKIRFSDFIDFLRSVTLNLGLRITCAKLTCLLGITYSLFA